MKRNIKMTISYDGTRYDGWQKQNNTSNTIQSIVEHAIFLSVNEMVEVCASGRTDAGVHAYAQVAHFYTTSNLSLNELKKSVNQLLPEDICIKQAEEVDLGFHSRYDAVSKIYEYRIQNKMCPNVFTWKYAYQISETLHVDKMKQAAKYLIGTHDFTSFTTKVPYKKSAVRSIYSIEFIVDKSDLILRYHGNGFLYHMVRILSGTLIEVGLGKRQPEEVQLAIDKKDRSYAGFMAPANALFLKQVYYKEQE